MTDATRRPRVPGLASLRSAKEGIAALEFALIAPVLFLIAAGAISLGLASWTKMQVGNAARAGAVYAAYHGYNLLGIRAAAQSATSLSNVTVTNPLPAIQSCVDPASGAISSAGTAKTCPGSGSPPGDYVTVTAQVSYSYILPIPGVADVGALSGSSVARIR